MTEKQRSIKEAEQLVTKVLTEHLNQTVAKKTVTEVARKVSRAMPQKEAVTA